MQYILKNDICKEIYLNYVWNKQRKYPMFFCDHKKMFEIIWCV